MFDSEMVTAELQYESRVADRGLNPDRSELLPSTDR